ncbi:MAG: hypothetical protein Q9184_006514 [Pyrenodesmia sp. 2 TL-2023]
MNSGQVVNNTDEWVPATPELPLRLYNSGSKRKWGQTAIDADEWAWWRSADDESWLRAAFHHVLREAMIYEASHQGTYRTWVVKNKTFSRGDCGPWGQSDVTAYHPQQNWSIERAHRPPKTFQIERRPLTEPTYPINIWVWRGIIVLDYKGLPLRDFKSIPATLSSEEDGCFLEGMSREDPRAAWKDFCARMPVRNPGPAPQPPGLYEPVMNDTGAAMRRLRFRMSAGCIAWKPRQGSKEIGKQIQAHLPPECLRANSTRGLQRDLTQEEIHSIEAILQEKNPRKAGKNAISEEARKFNRDIAEEKTQKSKRKAITEPEKASKKIKPGFDEDGGPDTVMVLSEQTAEADTSSSSDTDHQQYIVHGPRLSVLDPAAQMIDGPPYYSSVEGSYAPGYRSICSSADGQAQQQSDARSRAKAIELGVSNILTTQSPSEYSMSQNIEKDSAQRPVFPHWLPSFEPQHTDFDYGMFLNTEYLEEMSYAKGTLENEGLEGNTVSSASQELLSPEEPM